MRRDERSCGCHRPRWADPVRGVLRPGGWLGARKAEPDVRGPLRWCSRGAPGRTRPSGCGRCCVIPPACPNEVYEHRMASTLATEGIRGIDHVAFSDLFLENVRSYREGRLALAGKRGVFP